MNTNVIPQQKDFKIIQQCMCILKVKISTEKLITLIWSQKIKLKVFYTLHLEPSLVRGLAAP